MMYVDTKKLTLFKNYKNWLFWVTASHIDSHSVLVLVDHLDLVMLMNLIVVFRDVSTGAKGTTAVAPTFSDTLTLSPPSPSQRS